MWKDLEKLQFYKQIVENTSEIILLENKSVKPINIGMKIT